ncbi:hypothetical protein LO749_21605 (plasmid) [Paracoccus denitrificans]|nr:hypothetical protein [Paracoccus denitrificans]UFS68237.1 hypothetical protein LO749_21605 [Paracoccus denitrificans]
MALLGQVIEAVQYRGCIKLRSTDFFVCQGLDHMILQRCANLCIRRLETDKWVKDVGYKSRLNFRQEVIVVFPCGYEQAGSKVSARKSVLRIICVVVFMLTPCIYQLLKEITSITVGRLGIAVDPEHLPGGAGIHYFLDVAPNTAEHDIVPVRWFADIDVILIDRYWRCPSHTWVRAIPRHDHHHFLGRVFFIVDDRA